MGKTAAQELIEQGIEQGIERGIEQDKIQGKRQGIIQSKQEDLLFLIRVKFPSVSEEIEDKIKAIEDIDELTALFRQGLTAKSFDEMGIGGRLD